MGVKFHFLNVGVGDCTIIHFPEKEIRKDGQLLKTKEERITIMDINHHSDQEEYEHILDYYKSNPDFRSENGELKPIFRFICSHPHQDHICGLSELLADSEMKIFNFWDLEHSFTPEDFNHYETHEEDWNAYRTLGGGQNVTVIRTYREDTQRDFWKDDEDRITILSPSKELIKRAHFNEDGIKKRYR